MAIVATTSTAAFPTEAVRGTAGGGVSCCSCSCGYGFVAVRTDAQSWRSVQVYSNRLCRRLAVRAGAGGGSVGRRQRVVVEVVLEVLCAVQPRDVSDRDEAVDVPRFALLRSRILLLHVV